jgi:hypothetical protein
LQEIAYNMNREASVCGMTTRMYTKHAVQAKLDRFKEAKDAIPLPKALLRPANDTDLTGPEDYTLSHDEMETTEG